MLIRNSKRAGNSSGFTLLEVVLTASMAAIMALASATVFSSNLAAVDRAKRMTTGSQFLETVMEDLAAQPYENLLALNGNTIFDGELLVSSDFSVGLNVFEAGVGLVQVQAVLTDLGSQRRLGEVNAIRAQW